jgi:dipeptidyl aminopeptidase/acylaminoacyl peptidase
MCEECKGRLAETSQKVDEVTGQLKEKEQEIEEVHARLEELEGTIEEAKARREERMAIESQMSKTRKLISQKNFEGALDEQQKLASRYPNKPPGDEALFTMGLIFINADGTGVQRLLTSPGIDTEASFTHDGKALLFTSDRGGTPQIYRLTIATGAIERLTFEGSYNVSPRATGDGKGFVFVRRDGGRFQVAIQDYATRQVQVLTTGSLDESPSVSPNSRLILYAAMEQGGRGILAAVSADGRVKQRLVAPATEVREPAWGPLPR